MPATNGEIDDAVATSLSLTPSQRQVQAANGTKSEFSFRVGFCRSYLRIVGALKNERPGYWRVTSEGLEMTGETVERRLAEYRRHRQQEKLGQATNRQIQDVAATGTGGSVKDDPAASEAAWNDELLDRLLRMSPDAFERLAQELLRSSGFEAVKVVGGSGDGGIDGTALYRFSLISFPVYFQCKRHKGTIGAPVVRDFRGAMAGRGDRGLIITTGSFSRSAEREATRDGAAPLDLIDGDELCELLKEHRLGVAVKERTVEDVTIEHGYFDRFERHAKEAKPPEKLEDGVGTASGQAKRRSIPRAVTWSYRGQDRPEKNAADMYEHIVGQLFTDHGGVSFYRRFRDEIATNTRSHIGESRKEADPEERAIRSLPGGWYLNVHSPNKQKEKWIRVACECAGIEFGADLVIERP